MLLNISCFDLFFMCQLNPPPPPTWKIITPSKSWGPAKPPPLFENLVGGSTPPPPPHPSCRKGGRGGGAHYETLWKFLKEIIKAGLNVSFLLSSLLKDMHNSCFLTLYAPISQDGQTHWNNSSANCQWIVWVCLTILWDWHLKG